jgi:hypothetical protein
VWWPSRLWREPDHADRETARMLHAGESDGVIGLGQDPQQPAPPGPALERGVPRRRADAPEQTTPVDNVGGRHRR